MALAGSIVGTGNLVGQDSNTREFSKWQAEGVVWYVEENQEEEREWVALTEAAALAAVAAGSGEASMNLNGVSGVLYQNAAVEQDRVVGSYKYVCSAQVKTITPAP